MTPAERTAWVCERARSLGFDLCGVADPDALAELQHLPEWLARGYAGEMKYLRDPRRMNPHLVVEGARSVIVAALNYNSPQPHSTEFAAGIPADAPRAWISRYAWGDDYHDLIGSKLNALLAAMRAKFAEPFEVRAYVDTGPIVERVAAKYAGLGWLAKNTCLINQELGSWLFLGVIITTLKMAPSMSPGELPPPDLCGNCTACLDACPTEAFPEPYVLDARRCISYLTIELRGAIPEELREGIGELVFGCDICQDVCPWNRKAAVTVAKGFSPRKIEKRPKSELESKNSESAHEADGITVTNVGPHAREQDSHSPVSLFAPELEWIASLSQQEFSETFRRSPLKRAKWRGLVRNACVALGNARLPAASATEARVINLLESLARSEDDLIAEHARWALERLKKWDPKLEMRNSND